MAYTHYDRLTALDSTFLEIEDANVHMHVGAVALFDAAPLQAAGGGFDMDRILAVSETSLRRTPRFRQRLQWIPLFNRPVWVDDERFNLLYHVRHTSLPHPGSIRQLKRLVGRIMSQQLDRGKPLWEMWFVEGVEDGRVAVITKAHHCMIDGISGVDLLGALMTPDPQRVVGEPHPWMPRPTPSGIDLLIGELGRRATLPLAMLRAAGGAVASPAKTFDAIGNAVQGLGEALVSGLTPTSPTPLNPDIGPHRRFDWTRFDLAPIREIKQRLGGTVNDVVLAIVAGALRRFLRGRGLDVKQLDVRSMLPVSVRTASERGGLGNRVSFLMARLPLSEPDPCQRLRKVIAATQELKSSQQILGAEVLEEISDWTFTTLFVELVRLAARTRSYNLVVTNVPGPQFPVYLLGAKMEAIYPVVPLFSNQALGIALFSYDGGLYWGFNSDWDALPDLHDMVGAVEAELGLLQNAAAAAQALPSEPAKRAARKRRREKGAA